MRPSFYPTLYQSGGPRYLQASDFPNTTTLHGWQAASASNVFDTIFGGVSLSDGGSAGYISNTDHINNTKYCESEAGANLGTLTGTTNQSFSVFAWVYCDNWATNETASFLLQYFIDGSNFSQFLIFMFDAVVFVYCADSGTGSNEDASYNTGFTGSGWHSICVTRNVSTTETKIYIDGDLKVTGAAASSFTYDFDEVSPYALGCKTNDNWVHFGTVLSDAQIAALHAVGASV